jgi:hypothetical protein
MFTEIAKPITLVFCILSLYALFHVAFLDPSLDFEQRIYDSLDRLAVAAAISLIAGWIFRASSPPTQAHRFSLIATLPLKMFLWASGGMLLLFLISWYLRTNCIFYRDVRF